MFNVSGLINSLRTVSNAVMTATPIASALGIGEKVISMAEIALDIAKNVGDRVEEGTIVVASHEANDIKMLISELQAINDNLAEQIASS